MEHIGLAVFRNVPRGRECRLYFAVAINAGEAFKNIRIGDFTNSSGGPAVGSRCGGSNRTPTTRSVRGAAKAGVKKATASKAKNARASKVMGRVSIAAVASIHTRVKRKGTSRQGNLMTAKGPF